MGVPASVNWPTSLDDDTTLFGDPVNLAEFTLNGDIGSGDVTFDVNESISDLNVPLFMRFQTGELVYVEGMSTPYTLSSVTRGLISAAQSHDNAEIVRAVPAAEYIIMLKRAIIALETELGLNPSSATFADVAARLANHDHSGGDQGSVVDAIDADTVDGAHADDLYGEDVIYVRAFAFDKDVKVEDGTDYFTVPQKYDGKTILSIHIACYGAPSGGVVTGQVYNVTDIADIMSTRPTIDAGEYSSYTAVTAPVVGAQNTLAAGDRLRFDVDTANGAVGLDFIIEVDMN